MAEEKHMMAGKKKFGDIAVDGLLAGIVAGFLMAVYLTLAGLIGGEGLEAAIMRFSPVQNNSILVAIISHLAVSGIYGVIFALLFSGLTGRQPAARRFGWLAGLIYGIFLMLLAKTLILPATDSPLDQLSLVHLTIAHAIYGLTLGFSIGGKL